MLCFLSSNSYKLADSFISIPQPQALEFLERDTKKIDAEIEKLKATVDECQEEMEKLKVILYGKFGSNISEYSERGRNQLELSWAAQGPDRRTNSSPHDSQTWRGTERINSDDDEVLNCTTVIMLALQNLALGYHGSRARSRRVLLVGSSSSTPLPLLLWPASLLIAVGFVVFFDDVYLRGLLSIHLDRPLPLSS